MVFLASLGWCPCETLSDTVDGAMVVEFVMLHHLETVRYMSSRSAMMIIQMSNRFKHGVAVKTYFLVPEENI
jgi:hypothetical protein